jgi:hypothetical protein
MITLFIEISLFIKKKDLQAELINY